MMKVIHRSDTRGIADHGWLKSQHTFSFASYHDPERMGFGSLRVINDDVVQPSGGFGTHPHDNMEIVSIPLKGVLRHQDSMGNAHTIREGEVQIMSAGTGLTHSEYNASDSEVVNFLQIWVLPKERDITPRYGQVEVDLAATPNEFLTLVSPHQGDHSVWINQNAYFSMGEFEAGRSISYLRKQLGNGVYIFVIEGEVEVVDEILETRDAMGLADIDELEFESKAESKLLLIEVPM